MAVGKKRVSSTRKGVKPSWTTPRAEKPIARLGPGLFGDERAMASRDRINSADYRSCSFDIAAIADESYQSRLLTICETYWVDKDHDEQQSYALLQYEIKKLQVLLCRTIAAIRELKSSARAEINNEHLLNLENVDGPDKLAGVCDILERLSNASGRIIAPKYKKVGDVTIDACCDALKSLWKDSTGKPFRKTKTFAAGKNGPEYVAPNMQFVYVILQAINPAANAQTRMNSWLTKLSQTNPKKS